MLFQFHLQSKVSLNIIFNLIYFLFWIRGWGGVFQIFKNFPMFFFLSNEYLNIFRSRYVCWMNIRICGFNLYPANEYPIIFYTFQIWWINIGIYSTLLNLAKKYPNDIIFLDWNINIQDYEIEEEVIEDITEIQSHN